MQERRNEPDGLHAGAGPTRNDRRIRSRDQDADAREEMALSPARATRPARRRCDPRRRMRHRDVSVARQEGSAPRARDRKSVGEGRSGSVSVDLGGRASINKTTHTKNKENETEEEE